MPVAAPRVTAISFALSPDAVREKLAEKQQAEREALALSARTRLKERVAEAKAARQAELAALTVRHVQAREALRIRQDQETAKIKEAWRQVGGAHLSCGNVRLPTLNS